SRMPTYIRQALTDKTHFSETASSVHDNKLVTVCEEAHCPNRNECWNRGTATFMLLGDTCTRACGFCAVKTGSPDSVDQSEPARITQAVSEMVLDFVVLTSVNRDELPDGGATIFANTLLELRKMNSAIGVEFLTPDFRSCQEKAIAIVAETLAVAPYSGEEAIRLIWGHNIETVPSLYKEVRKGSKYERSLEMLRLAAEVNDVETKSSIILGLGETEEEVYQVMQDLRANQVSRIALGQYLRPTRYHLPVKEYLALEQFSEYEKMAQALGFSWVKSGPMVRSSYHAEE
ncbi:MAG: lipoyl synthase, partial [gamma proteobacterium symbiont of Bathyaustriella thionipta]|nr:lipoyl synthase [gamma proteobacterium symbiont of Bathyaustriella thionipta]MCU7956805.1 lipoyl synthase [gamma proteobacterium symbiont of Bathyaustriella thionipta]